MIFTVHHDFHRTVCVWEDRGGCKYQERTGQWEVANNRRGPGSGASFHNYLAKEGHLASKHITYKYPLVNCKKNCAKKGGG